MSEPVILCENLLKIYKTDQIEVVALKGLDLQVNKGEMMAIIGSSGSGKSTLLNILCGLEKPSAGQLFVCGQDMLRLSDRQVVSFIRENIGFVWQNSARNLIPYLTALENIELPMIMNRSRDRVFALELLELVGLAHRRNHKLSQLSGGEQQRIAIAIALSSRPKLVLADEPTGAIDTKTTVQILDLLKTLGHTMEATTVIVTHDHEVSKYVDRVVSISEGITSGEFLKRVQAVEVADTHEAENEKIIGHEEFSVVDRNGRLQLPKEYLERLGVSGRDRVKVVLEEQGIVIRK